MPDEAIQQLVIEISGDVSKLEKATQLAQARVIQAMTNIGNQTGELKFDTRGAQELGSLLSSIENEAKAVSAAILSIKAAENVLMVAGEHLGEEQEDMLGNLKTRFDDLKQMIKLTSDQLSDLQNKLGMGGASQAALDKQLNAEEAAYKRRMDTARVELNKQQDQERKDKEAALKQTSAYNEQVETQILSTAQKFAKDRSKVTEQRSKDDIAFENAYAQYTAQQQESEAKKRETADKRYDQVLAAQQKRRQQEQSEKDAALSSLSSQETKEQNALDKNLQTFTKQQADVRRKANNDRIAEEHRVATEEIASRQRTANEMTNTLHRYTSIDEKEANARINRAQLEASKALVAANKAAYAQTEDSLPKVTTQSRDANKEIVNQRAASSAIIKERQQQFNEDAKAVQQAAATRVASEHQASLNIIRDRHAEQQQIAKSDYEQGKVSASQSHARMQQAKVEADAAIAEAKRVAKAQSDALKANAGQLINQQQTVAKQQIAQTTAESHAFVNTNPQFADAQRKALDARVAAEHRATMTTMEEDHKRALNTVQTEYERGEITAKVARLRIAQEKLVAEQTIEQAKRTAIALSESSEQIVNKQAADARRRMNIEAGVANNTIAMHPQAPQPKGGVTQDQIGIYGTSYMMGHMLTITGLLSDALTTLGQRLTSVAQESAMTTGEFQRVSVSLESLTGSAERAKTFMKELQTYEAKVPATLPEMFDYARMLKGAGYATKDVIPVFNAVGNAAAGLGQGSAGIKRFMLALEGLRTGAPIGRELRAMAQDIYGSRPIEHIAKGLELSTATVRDKIKKGELTGKQIADALIRGLDADPAFKGAMEKMMDTLPGKLSTLESAVYKLKVAFGSVVSPDILRFMDKLIAGANLLVDKFEKMSPSAKHAIAMVVLIGGAALTASGHMMKFSGSMAYIIGELALFNMTLKSSGQSFASMIGGMAKASIPIMGIVAAIAMIGGALVLAYTQNKEFASQVNELWSTLKENILAIVYGIDMRFEEFGTTTLKVLGHAMENITEVISSACLGIAQLLEGFLDALTGNWGAAWEHMGSAVVNMFKGLLLGLPKLIGELGGIIGMAISGMFEKADQKAYQRLSSEVTTLQRRNIVISEQMRINTDRMKTANPDDKRTLIDTNQTLAQTRNDNNRRIRQLLAEMKEKNKNFAHDTAGDLRFMDTVFDFSSPKWSGNAWIPKKTKVGKDGPEPGANEHDDEAKEAAKAKENPLITMAKALAAANATEALQKKNPGLFPDFDVFTEKANIFKTAINAVIADATGDHDWFGSLSAGLDALNKKGKDLSIVDRAKLTADTAAVIKVYKDYEKAIADVDETERTLGRSSATLDTALKATFSAMRSLQKLGMTTGPQYASLSTQYDALLTETNTRIARDAQDKDLFDSQQKLYALQGEKARLDATPATTSTDAMERQRQVAEYQQKQGNLAIDMSQVVDAQKIKDKYRQKLIDEQANNKQIGDDRKKQIEEEKQAELKALADIYAERKKNLDAQYDAFKRNLDREEQARKKAEDHVDILAKLFGMDDSAKQIFKTGVQMEHESVLSQTGMDVLPPNMMKQTWAATSNTEKQYAEYGQQAAKLAGVTSFGGPQVPQGTFTMPTLASTPIGEPVPTQLARTLDRQGTPGKTSPIPQYVEKLLGSFMSYIARITGSPMTTASANGAMPLIDSELPSLSNISNTPMPSTVRSNSLPWSGVALPSLSGIDSASSRGSKGGAFDVSIKITEKPGWMDAAIDKRLAKPGAMGRR